MESKVIAVDFDGTLCESKWPEIGKPNKPLIQELKRRRASGTKLILWTCREGDILEQAVEWCRERGLEFDAINENLPERIAEYGGDCRKISADEYIDDKSCIEFKLPFVARDCDNCARPKNQRLSTYCGKCRSDDCFMFEPIKDI